MPDIRTGPPSDPRIKENAPFIVRFPDRCFEDKEDEMEDQTPMTDREFVDTLVMILSALIVYVVTIGPLRIL